MNPYEDLARLNLSVDQDFSLKPQGRVKGT